jgi:mercuric ion transport protein
MKLLEKGAPAAAMLAAVSTLACCLPLGFIGAVGFASLGARVQPLRPWFIAASIVFLCVGFVQLYLRKSCAKRSIPSMVLFWAAVLVVVLVLLFPQVIASLIAG